MAVTRRLRYEVFRRDDHACRYCGARAPDATLTIDHVIPIALGGKDEPGNLVTACKDCNAGKSSVAPDAPLVEGVEADALRWGKAMELAANAQAAASAESEAFTDAFFGAWKVHWVEDWQEHEQAMRLPSDWRSSVERFRAGGLDGQTIFDAVDKTMAATRVHEKHLFRYFCGICWRVLDERQEIAKGIIATEEGEDA